MSKLLDYFAVPLTWRLRLCVSVALALLAVPGFGQTITNWVGGTDANYFTKTNWSDPNINFGAITTTTLNIGPGNPNNPSHTGGSISSGYQPQKFNVLTGGNFTIAGKLYPYNSDSLNGNITVNAPGDFSVRNVANIGYLSGAVVTVNGGSLSTRNGMNIALGVNTATNQRGRATVTVAGGSLNVGGGGSNMDLNLANGAGLTAQLNITGGAVNIVRNLNVGSGGNIFISSIGQLKITGDKTAQLNGLVASGQLTCPAGETLDIVYNGTSTIASIYRNPNSLYRELPTQVVLKNGATGAGALEATIDKATSNLISLKLNGVETLNQLGTSRKGGYYDLTTSAGFETMNNCVFSVTKDQPDVVDVAFKRAYNSATGQVTPVDVEIHYVLNLNDTGLYTYSVLEHKPAYPAFDLGSWRQVLWIAQNGADYLCEKIYTDPQRSWQMPSVTDFNQASATGIAEIVKLNTGVRAGKYDGKYQFSLPFWEVPVYGHASDVNQIGSWIVLGSAEFFNDGPTFHDLNAAAGILHVCMNGVHYNAAGMSVPQGEQWRKLYGPYLIYTSTGATGNANWAAAQQRATEEKAKWPYAWLTGNPEYPLAAGRGSLTGQFVVQDPLKPAVTGKNAWIGVTQLSNPAQQWQFEEKNYQHWVKTDAQGNFNLANVRPGSYTLFAYTDGEVGEYSQQNVVVTAGTATSLGTVTWDIPRTSGRLLWEIGVPNRKADEFKFGDFDYCEGFVYDKFNTTFANPIEYDVSANNWATALPYAHSPYPTSTSTQTTWKWRLNFTLPATLPTTGSVKLTIAAASSDRSNEFVYVNDESRLFTSFYPDNGGGNALLRQSNYAKYGVKTISIPMDKLRPGANTITLMMASSQAMSNHVMYDYISLEGDLPAVAPLPVALVAFTATRRSPEAALLSWETASERNNAHFEVEASTDGVAFRQLGRVAGHGTSTQAHTYTFTDAGLVQYAAPQVYYRLRQVDTDGTSTYSPVRTLALADARPTPLVAYPVPAHGQLQVRGAQPSTALTLRDLVGRLVYTAAAAADGSATLSLPAGLPAGVYLLQNDQQTLRVTIE
jgi:hypothetical protein